MAALACSCISRLLNQADVAVGRGAATSDSALAALDIDAALSSLAAAACVASLAIDDDLAYLSRSSVASYRLPRIPRVFAKRSLNVSAPGVSPLVPRSVSK